MIFYGVAFEVALLLLLIYLPLFQSAFGFAPLGLNHWLLLLTFPILLFIIEESRKVLRKSLSK
jgi:P-type Ca2+ transporter type 2C